MNNLAEAARNAAHRIGERAFCHVWRGESRETITFSNLYERGLQYAALYRERGLVRGDLVVIALEHGPDAFHAFVGAVLAGAVPSFIPCPSSKQQPQRFWAEHERLFKRITPALIVSCGTHAEALALHAAPDRSITLTGDERAFEPLDSAARDGLNAAPDAVAALQHSSGTTGLKKGMMLSHRAVLAQLSAYARAIELQPDDVIASWLPLYHDMGFVACFLNALVNGLTLVALDPFEWASRPRILLDAIEQYRATLCWLPNFAFAHLVNATPAHAQWSLSCVRAFISCSEPCKPRAFDRFLERFSSSGVGPQQLAVCYALAENVFAATQTPLRGPVARKTTRSGRSVELLSCGPPIEGVSIDVRDDGGSPVPDGTVGEVTLAGPFLFDGYFREPERTSRVLRDGRYFTGDLGFLEGGELYVTGRRDDLLVVNGRNVHAHEIEAIVSEVAGCVPGRAVARCEENASADGSELVVFTEIRPEAAPATVGAAIKQEVSDRLGLPVHRVVTLERGALVKTTSGKVVRSLQ